MDGGWLARARWRRRGNWLWPLFAGLVLLDGLIGHLLPPTGDSQSWVGIAVIAGLLNLLAVLLLGRPSAALLRRRRPDLPPVVAYDYAGRALVLTVTAILLAAGLAHRPAILAEHRALSDAIVRAQAYIGDRAPAQFRRNLRWVSTFAIEPGHIYRTCVPSDESAATYCVVVNVDVPFPQGVSFAGYESNGVFAQGAG